MKNKNALSTERQPTPEELVTTIAASCHYDITEEQRVMARLAQQYGTVKTVTVTQDFNKLIQSE